MGFYQFSMLRCSQITFKLISSINLLKYVVLKPQIQTSRCRFKLLNCYLVVMSRHYKYQCTNLEVPTDGRSGCITNI